MSESTLMSNLPKKDFYLRKCKECKGDGSLVIYNAYDPDYREVVKCDHCGGVGFCKSNGERLVN